MKKIIYLLFFVALAFISCSKKDGTADLAQPEINTDPFKPVPDHFTKKVLIEELTASWCGYCPRGNHYWHYIDSVYSGKAIGVSIHVSDVMEDYQLVTSS